MCYTLRNSPSLRDRLGATAGRVFATTFGCPPVMTLELSLVCADFVTSVVYANDMVARTCVHNIQVCLRLHPLPPPNACVPMPAVCLTMPAAPRCCLHPNDSCPTTSNLTLILPPSLEGRLKSAAGSFPDVTGAGGRDGGLQGRGVCGQRAPHLGPVRRLDRRGEDGRHDDLQILCNQGQLPALGQSLVIIPVIIPLSGWVVPLWLPRPCHLGKSVSLPPWQLLSSKHPIPLSLSHISYWLPLPASHVTLLTTFCCLHPLQRLGSLALVRNPLMQAALAAGVSWVGNVVAEKVQASGGSSGPERPQNPSSAAAGGAPQPSGSSSSSLGAGAGLSPAQIAASGAALLGSALLSWGSKAVDKVKSKVSSEGAAGPSALGLLTSNPAPASSSSFTNLASTLLLPRQQQPSASGPSASAGSGGILGSGGSAMMLSAASAALTAALSAPVGRGTEAALASLRQSSNSSSGIPHQQQQVYGVPSPVVMGVPVQPPPMCNPLGAHPPPQPLPPQKAASAPPLPPPPLTRPAGGQRDDDGTQLVPEQQSPLYNAGRLYFIERRGE